MPSVQEEAAWHWPLRQVDPAAQASPQAPQLFGSAVRSAQPPAQVTNPAGQTQTALVQVAPAMQEFPHPPQLAGSLFTSVQRLPQFTSPRGQAHCPLMHVAPLGQECPQAPQLEISLVRSLHTPPQFVCPSGQTPPQMPAMQTWLWQSEAAKQLLPFAQPAQTGPPQSTSVSLPFFIPSKQDDPAWQMPPEQLPLWQSPPTRHALPAAHAGQIVPPQSTSVSDPSTTWSKHVEVATHWPLTQVSPAEQACPQAPQLFASVERFAQAVPQLTSPAGHVQKPAVQVAPVGQACPQLPQFAESLARSAHTPPQLDWPAEHAAAQRPAMQIWLWQSDAETHAFPVAQAAQIVPPQSTSVSLPSLTPSKHEDPVWQTPPAHVPLWQSEPVRHPFPAEQAAQIGPPQSMSVSLPSLTASKHEDPAWQMPPEQIPVWQSEPTRHPFPATQAAHNGPPQSMSVSDPSITRSKQDEELWHWPLTQVSPAEQACPQAPQLPWSDAIFAQAAEQATVPRGQVQTPLEHAAPEMQDLPQAPQLPGSELTSEQTPAQDDSPAGQAHTPLTHVPPIAQACPQAPQFPASAVTSVHTPPQSTCPPGQLACATRGSVSAAKNAMDATIARSASDRNEAPGKVDRQIMDRPPIARESLSGRAGLSARLVPHPERHCSRPCSFIAWRTPRLSMAAFGVSYTPGGDTCQATTLRSARWRVAAAVESGSMSPCFVVAFAVRSGQQVPLNRPDTESMHRRSHLRIPAACALALLCACVDDARATPESVAASDPRVTCIGAVSGTPAARVTAPISIADAAGIAAFQVDVRYDSGLLTLVGARPGADTAAAGGWLVDSQALGAGLVRVLGYSMPPAGLAAGSRTVALVDFDVASSQPIQDVPFPLANCVLGDARGLSLSCSFCVQPGVDGATPRFAVSQADDGFAFAPARIAIESGDWVLWRNVGSSRDHTTTSGTGCVADGRWRADLPPGGRFVRRFPEAPGSVLPYFSEPDCVLGMTGEVDVTTDIHLSVAEVSGSALLTWTGGSGVYRAFRSAAPAFVGPSNATFVPDGGDSGTSLSDSEPVPVGTVLYYLVLDKP